MNFGIWTSWWCRVWKTWSVSCLKKPVSPRATEPRFLKIILKLSFWEWLNYNINWILSLMEHLLFKWEHWLGRNWILNIAMVPMGRSWWSGSMEPLNSAEPSFPIEAALPPLSGNVKPSVLRKVQWPPLWQLPCKALLILLRAYPTTFFASISITRLKSQPQKVRYKVTHETGYCAPKELNDFSNLYKQKSQECVWGWILRAWDSEARNTK